MKVSVISATFNRAEMLDNALYTYSKQTLPFEDWEYLIADDASQDNTAEVVQRWAGKGLPVRYFSAPEDLHLPKQPGQWRDGCKVRNAVSTWAFGEVLVATHPEIMIPPNALQVMYDAVRADPWAWVTAIPYWLPQGEMPAWKRDLNNLRTMEGFYDPTWPDPIHSPGAPDYRNQNQERRGSWESEVFWAMAMDKWRWLGGFRNFAVWGSVDMDFVARRQRGGFHTVIAKDPDSPAESGNLMVYHQWHGESPRDMDAAMKAMEGQDYSTVESMRAQGGLYAIYHHGHRERADDGELGGILGDHIQRYEWADFFCNGKVVLDIPCGTGYGCQLITSTPYYYGMDIDAESIEFAEKTYGDGKRQFEVGDMTDIPLPDNSVDQILCFEGLEHIRFPEDAVAEFHRVLRKGGNIIVSTPQKGAAIGTPWDINVLTYEQLLALFPSGKWEGLDPFYQMSYGYSPVQEGVPPAGAQIMILGATCVE